MFFQTLWARRMTVCNKIRIVDKGSVKKKVFSILSKSWSYIHVTRERTCWIGQDQWLPQRRALLLESGRRWFHWLRYHDFLYVFRVIALSCFFHIPIRHVVPNLVILCARGTLPSQWVHSSTFKKSPADCLTTNWHNWCERCMKLTASVLKKSLTLWFLITRRDIAKWKKDGKGKMIRNKKGSKFLSYGLQALVEL